MLPLLSICIPTYNRAEQLKQCLDSIVAQDLFVNSDKIEVVISDNCSTDNTFNVVKEFMDEYPQKIKYFKTEKNIGFDNFEQVLKKGKGLFLKLHNDYLVLENGALNYIVTTIENNKDQMPVLFFGNNDKENKTCAHLNEFINEISFFNTWIASFGLWKSDFEKKSDWFRYNSSSLPQTDILCRIIVKGKTVEIINKHLFESLSVSKKGGYNIAQVFGYNYLKILKEFVAQGQLSQKVYEKEKKNILLKHTNHFYFDLNHQYAFTKDGYFKWLLPDYKYNLYFYIAYIKIMFLHLSKIILKPLAWVFSVYSKKKKGYKLKILHILGIKIVIKKKKLK